jgi:hypothetical protein
MTMRSPILAMLWEQWRLTRIEAAQRFVFGIVAASAALVIFDSATAAFWILVTLHGMLMWLSILKLNGGRFMDGYKPGFPFYLHYTRPLSTVTFVAVGMAYVALSCAALYVISAALLGFVVGQALPVFTVVPWIVAFHLCYACVQWSTSSRTVQWLGSIAFSWPLFFWLYYRTATPPQVEFSLVENVSFALIGVVAFVLTLAGVARQRRGETFATTPRTESAGYPSWLVTLLPFNCPTSSAIRAQVWYELKSSGMPVLAIGVAVASVVVLLFAMGVHFALVRPAAVAVAAIAPPFLLFTLGNNSFGVRRKQGRTYLSAFHSTQPFATERLAGLKILVRTVCVLGALFALGASVWVSSAFMLDWGAWMVAGDKDVMPALLKLRRLLVEAFGDMTMLARFALAALVFIIVAGLVAWQAAREALRARYPRALAVIQWLPAAWGLAVILLALAGRNGVIPVSVPHAFFIATFCISGIALLVGTLYLFWNGIAERALTVPYALGAVAIAAMFAGSWIVIRPATTSSDASMIGIAWLALAILMLIVLAPWSLDRSRHT